MAYKNAVAESGTDENFDESYLDTAQMMKENAIKLWDINAIKADVASCGLAGSPTKVKKIDSVVLKSADIKMIDNNEKAIADMIHELIEDHTIG
jgi:electron transfer flavoprotein beta subunit